MDSTRHICLPLPYISLTRFVFSSSISQTQPSIPSSPTKPLANTPPPQPSTQAVSSATSEPTAHYATLSPTPARSLRSLSTAASRTPQVPPPALSETLASPTLARRASWLVPPSTARRHTRSSPRSPASVTLIPPLEMRVLVLGSML